jgi:hypothetical protein
MFDGVQISVSIRYSILELSVTMAQKPKHVGRNFVTVCTQCGPKILGLMFLKIEDA